MLAAAADRLPVLLGNSGVGKSSLAQAGVLAALKRQAWPESADTALDWPVAFQESRRWCFLTPQARDRASQGAGRIIFRYLATWRDRSRASEAAKWLDQALACYLVIQALVSPRQPRGRGRATCGDRLVVCCYFFGRERETGSPRRRTGSRCDGSVVTIQ